MISQDRANAAERYEDMANEFELAAKHSRIAARHFSEGDVARGCAHAFASQGHALRATELLGEAAKLHSTKARLEI